MNLDDPARDGWTERISRRPPTAREALEHLRFLCDEADAIRREQIGAGPTHTGFLATPTVRRVVESVPVEPRTPAEAVLRITEEEAGWILGRWTPEKADLAAEALAVHAHAEQKAGHTDTATAALELAAEITAAAR